MEGRKNLYDISWQVDEPTYRADEALSYSTLAKFAREGFNKLDSLFDKVETPSLTFGSAVDALITGGQEEFDNNFMVADFEVPTDSVLKMVLVLFGEFGVTHNTLSSIPNEEIIGRTEALKYQLNWKPETRAKVIKEQGGTYYSLLYSANGRKIIDTATAIPTNNIINPIFFLFIFSSYFLVVTFLFQLLFLHFGHFISVIVT